MKALGNGKKDAPVLYVPGTTSQSPELVTSPASPRLRSGWQRGQAGPWSQSGTDWAEVLTLGICQSESSYFLLKIPRIQDFHSNPLGIQPALEFPGARGTGCASFERFQTQEQPAPVLVLSNTRSLASGRQVAAAQESMKRVGPEGPSHCSWQRWPWLQQALPDLPVSWHQPYPKFLKLSPFFRIEQLQDGYFCCFS